MKSYVFITGAAGGLGKAFTIECAARGWNLFLTDLSEDLLFVLSNSIKNTYNIKVEYFAADLTKQKDRSELFENLKLKEISFWCLINVAGIEYEGNFIKNDCEDLCKIIRLNVESTLFITYNLIKLRDKTRAFRIINVSSLAAFYPMPIKATYAASKSFILNFSIALREEIRSLGGTVTILCPAGMPTHDRVIQSINVQGLLGIITTLNIGYIASKTIDYALKGRLIYIPGILNNILRVIGSFVPSKITARLIGLRWSKFH